MLSSENHKGDARGLGRHIWDIPASGVFSSYKVRRLSDLEMSVEDYSTDVDHRRVDILAFGSTNKIVVFIVLLFYPRKSPRLVIGGAICLLVCTYIGVFFVTLFDTNCNELESRNNT